jgi:hypothetical protein
VACSDYPINLEDCLKEDDQSKMQKRREKAENQYLESTHQLPSHARDINNCGINFPPCFASEGLAKPTFPLECRQRQIVWHMIDSRTLHNGGD